MKKNIWIWNHYATNTFKERGGRHYWFAKNLKEQGYNPTIFCANTIHNSDQYISTQGKKYFKDEIDGITYVFIKTSGYKSNGIDRIKNMVSFYISILSTVKKYVRQQGKPDIILASSVHPLTLVAGIKTAKKLGIPCICEIRDLWPETIVEYDKLERSSIIAKILYEGEKWIYRKADKLIFTMEGGRDYIINQKWDKENNGVIDINKVYHINNGVDLDDFEYNIKNNILEDQDLIDINTFKVVYTGSIRLGNDIKSLVEVAKIIQKRKLDNIQFLIYGEGDQKEFLSQYCKENSIKNVKFKGKVDKKYIPYILSKGNLNLIHVRNDNICQYGASRNKMFEYFASGKPVYSNVDIAYSIIKKYKCGIEKRVDNSEDYANIIETFYNMPKEQYTLMCKMALVATKQYEFKFLTNKLIEIIEE